MTTGVTAQQGSARVAVQRFGTFLSNMVLPNIAAFIAWGLITAIFEGKDALDPVAAVGACVRKTPTAR